MKTAEERSEKEEGEYALPLWSWKIGYCKGSVPLQSIWALPVLYFILFMLLLGNKVIPRKAYPLSLYSRECIKTGTSSRWRQVMERKGPVQVIYLYLLHKLACFSYCWRVSWKAQLTREWYGVPLIISPIVVLRGSLVLGPVALACLFLCFSGGKHFSLVIQQTEKYKIHVKIKIPSNLTYKDWMVQNWWGFWPTRLSIISWVNCCTVLALMYKQGDVPSFSEGTSFSVSI